MRLRIRFGLTLLIFVFLSNVQAQGIYKYTDKDGIVRYTTKAPEANPIPAQLPNIKREAWISKAPKVETCAKHGGVDCSKGADTDGSVICLDDYRNATNRYNFTCLEARMDIEDVQEKNNGLEYSVFVRNSSGVKVTSPMVTYESPEHDKVQLNGPNEIAPFGVAEFKLQLTSPLRVKPNHGNIIISCVNCS